MEAVLQGDESIQKASSSSHSRSVAETLFVSFLPIKGTRRLKSNVKARQRLFCGHCRRKSIDHTFSHLSKMSFVSL